MTADHSSEVPESASAPPCADEDADFSQNSSKSAAVDVTSSSATPIFAFAAWKAELELLLRQESEILHESVQALQSDFDDRSQFVRGDFAWRKQVTAFQDRLQDVLTNRFSTLVTNVSKHAAQVAESLAQTLAKVERDGQRAVRQQEQQGESALRRTRTALAKEVERITRLEKCLRLEEARQAAAMLAERECQLIAEHSARENHLQALLGDMRSSNETLETLNSQLLDALRTSRSELDQLRNALVKSNVRPKRKDTNFARGESRSPSVESSNRGGVVKSGKNSITRDLDSLPSTANDLLLVPALRQSLDAANQTVANLKNRVSELESARESDKQRLRELQLALAQAENEKAKATKLLGEARSALINNERKLVEAAKECASWQDKVDSVQVVAESRERALADSQRLQEASCDQLTALTRRLQRVMTIEVRSHEFEHAVVKWRENRKELGTETSQSAQVDNQTLEHIVESYLGQEAGNESAPIELLSSMETQKELEVRLRYEFEKRFGDQLSLRVRHERRRVLERLERLCATEAKDTKEQSQRTRQSFSNLESDLTRLKRLLKAAYDQLGICVGAWSETDLDGLYARLDALKAKVKALENEMECAANRAESQRVSLVRAELAQQEKDLLLAELTSRYRQLRASQVAWDSQYPQQEQQRLQQRQPVNRKPLAVYGVAQRVAQKPKLHALIHLPARSRPASAAACLESVKNTTLHRLSQPSPSRHSSRLGFTRHNLDLTRKLDDERVEKVEDHVRSVLKSALMQSEIENQLDCENTVGSDGVLEILHRRRHRKYSDASFQIASE